MKNDLTRAFLGPLAWTAGMFIARLFGLYTSPSASVIAVSMITAAFIIKHE